MKPNFQHDCDKCFFLGRIEEVVEVHPDFAVLDEDWERVFGFNNKKHVDLYYCEKQVHGPTVIARYSDEGGDYASGIAFSDSNPHLKAAKNLAIAKGLLGGA